MSKLLQLYIGGGTAKWLQYYIGGGMPKWLQYYISPDPKKWLRNMCTTPNEIWPIWSLGILQLGKIDSNTKIEPELKMVDS